MGDGIFLMDDLFMLGKKDERDKYICTVATPLQIII